MKTANAITTFSQSEKIKGGLIWLTQAIELFKALPEADKAGAEKIIKALVDMVGSEILICKKSAPDERWLEVEKNIDTALVMINSGVTQEAGYHLTQALTQVTTIGQRSMTVLKDNGHL